MVRRKVLEEGVSRRQLARQTGLSRNTIRKMLLHELPQPYKPRTRKHPALRQHTATLDAIATSSVFTIVPQQVSISEIYRYLKRQENYSASYGAVRDYLRFRFCARQAPNKILWEHLYEEIISSEVQRKTRLISSGRFPSMALRPDFCRPASNVSGGMSRACVSIGCSVLGMRIRDKTWTG